MGLYAEQIAQTPLLDIHRERLLAQHMLAGKMARQNLHSRAAISEAERCELETQQHQGERARQDLVLANLRLVFSVARRYQSLVAGRGKVRLASRHQVQHLRRLVDSPGRDACLVQPKSYHSPAILPRRTVE